MSSVQIKASLSQNTSKKRHPRQLSLYLWVYFLMSLLLLIHNKTDLEIKKDNLHLISVWTFSYLSSVLFAIFMNNMLVEWESLRTFPTCQRINQWGESSMFQIHNSTIINSLFSSSCLMFLWRHGIVWLSNLYLIQFVCPLECTLGVLPLFFLTEMELGPTQRLWCSFLWH